MHLNNWRDCDAWRSFNLPLGTLSNEAAKLYDINLSQLFSWRENEQYGGLLNSLNLMYQADPNFILGKCLKYGLELLGSNQNHNSVTYYENVQELVRSASASSGNLLNKREKLHVKAVEMLQYGNLPLAVEYLEQILFEHPNDCHALKILHSLYFYMGESKQMHESLARVLPRLDSREPYFSYIHGMYGFGLAQDNYLDRAACYAHKALEMNGQDAWATHAICHVNEYKSNFNQGIKFLLDTEQDWSKCNMIASHNYWHMSLYYLERNDCESAIDILDKHMMNNLNSVLNIINASSLLFRLKLNNFQENSELLKEKWIKVRENCLDKVNCHGYMYSDSHFALALATCGTKEDESSFFAKCDEYINADEMRNADENFSTLKISDVIGGKCLESFENFNYLRETNRELRGIFEAIFSYQQNQYEKVVELLYPIRYKIKKIGGSNAQRDIFNLILLESAFKSSLELHNTLGISLMNERLLNRPDSDFTKRLAQRFFAND